MSNEIEGLDSLTQGANSILHFLPIPPAGTYGIEFMNNPPATGATAILAKNNAIGQVGEWLKLNAVIPLHIEPGTPFQNDEGIWVCFSWVYYRKDPNTQVTNG